MKPPRGAVLSQLRRHTRASVGLSFIPPVVKHFTERVGSGVPSTREVWDTLYDLHRDGKIELRPEGGLNRLSSYDLYLAPPGPQGTRLTWARLGVGGPRRRKHRARRRLRHRSRKTF